MLAPVSVDVYLLFTMVPIGDALRLLRRHIDENILRLFRYVRTSSFGYTNLQTRRVLNPPANVAPPPEEPNSIAFLPCVKTTFIRISRLLSRLSVGLPKEIPGFLRPVKINLGLKTSSDPPAGLTESLKRTAFSNLSFRLPLAVACPHARIGSSALARF